MSWQRNLSHGDGGAALGRRRGLTRLVLAAQQTRREPFGCKVRLAACDPGTAHRIRTEVLRGRAQRERDETSALEVQAADTIATAADVVSRQVGWAGQWAACGVQRAEGVQYRRASMGIVSQCRRSGGVRVGLSEASTPGIKE